ncbi:MAG: hypothetical protein AB7T22_14485 [Calditrichaceae bacterium]
MMGTDFPIKQNLICLIFILFVFVVSCTENPFWDDNISSNDRQVVEGAIRLSDDSQPDSVMVWLEGFDLVQKTDKRGAFKHEIPLSSEQPGGGLNGVYNLYSYLGNYRLASIPLLVLDGQFEYDKSGIDERGKISDDIILTKMLEIKTTIEPAEITTNIYVKFEITIEIENVVDSVEIMTYLDNSNYFGSIIFRHIQIPGDAIFIRDPLAGYVSRMITEQNRWTISFSMDGGFFTPGQYEVIPYLNVTQDRDQIPHELMKKFGFNADGFDPDYLNVPFKRKTAILTVKNPDQF